MENKVKKRVLVLPSDENGSGWYRMIQPYGRVVSGGVVFDVKFLEGEVDGVYLSELFGGYDGILCQRVFDWGLLGHLRKFQEGGGIVVMDCDDLLMNIPSFNISRVFWDGEKLKGYREAMRICDYLHSSTEELSGAMGYRGKTCIFKNAVDISVKLGDSAEKDFRGRLGIPMGMKVIMWGGSTGHNDTLEFLLPIIKHYSTVEGVVVVLVGNRSWMAKFGVVESESVFIIDSMELKDYLYLPAMADVFLTPLMGNLEFNRCKSELKVLESGVWGVPCVSSDVEPYRRFNVICGGGNVLVKNKFSDWVSAINRLLIGGELYDLKSREIYEGVSTMYNIDTVNAQRVAWWESVLFNSEKHPE